MRSTPLAGDSSPFGDGVVIPSPREGEGWGEGRSEQASLRGSTASETRYFYGGVAMWQVIEEQDGNGATLAGYVHGSGIDELVAMDRDTNGDGQSERYFFHADDLGNVMAVTDAAGQVVERYDYDDFGRPSVFDAQGGQRAESAIGNPYLFTGREFDAETGLYHYRTRYYDPVTGRFMTRDTIGIWGDADELGNGSSYVSNNPWTTLDPFGFGDVRPNSATQGALQWLQQARSAVKAALEALKKNPTQGNYQKAMDAINQYAEAVEQVAGKKVANAVRATLRKLAEYYKNRGNPGWPKKPPPIPDLERMEQVPEIPPYPHDPTQPPGPGWEWEGDGPPGSPGGKWTHPDYGDLKPDLEHPPPMPPHWDWEPNDGSRWRYFPDGEIWPVEPPGSIPKSTPIPQPTPRVPKGTCKPTPNVEPSP
jgi:RHS repeat-associated protein